MCDLRPALKLKCRKGLCDVVLIDSSFSTCKDENSGIGFAYLGGIARADNVPQDSLHDFDLNLYCVTDLDSLDRIDYSVDPIILAGNLVFLEDGLVRRLGPGKHYLSQEAL